MRYKAFYENNPMVFALAKRLSASLDQGDEQKRLCFLTINILGISLSQGHVCVDLSAYDEKQSLIDCDVDAALPPIESWLDTIRQWPFVTEMQLSTLKKELLASPFDIEKPLVLLGNKLYLTKYFSWEKELAKSLINMSRDSYDIQIVDGGAQNSEIDWQQVAVNNSLLSKLSIVVGGPGTGKTTTVARILSSILKEENNADYRIGLCAPTGKAAARMAQALTDKIKSENLPEVLKQTVPDQALTLHRFLGWSPIKRVFTYNKSHQLPYDCIVVDEVSMIDLSMFSALLNAASPTCRLILLGDPYQLASVQAGNVLGELAREEWINQYTYSRSQALGITIVDEAVSDFSNSLTALRKSYRFNANEGVGQLAQYCQQGEAEKLHSVFDNVSTFLLNKQLPGSFDSVLDKMKAHHDHVCEAETVEQAFSRLEDFQVLCGLKVGDFSLSYFNTLMSDVAVWQQKANGMPIYHGMPVMMQKNDHQLKLFNGDVGLIWLKEGELKLFFQSLEGELREFVPSQIPAWECAHAITVHKSQGSEYRDVVIVLPPSGSPLLTREMLYTAVTRAKEKVYCLATDQEIVEAVRRPTERFSSLSQMIEVLGV